MGNRYCVSGFPAVVARLAKPAAAISLCLWALAGAQPAEAAALEGAIDLEAGPDLPAIGLDELRGMLEARMPLVLVDARGPEAYAMGHLPQALNIPAAQVERMASTLPKGALIVVYCGGPSCPHASIVGRWLIAHGWPLVRHYAQGFPAWQQAGYPVEQGGGRSKEAGEA